MESQQPSEADLKKQKLEEKIKRRQMELKEKSQANVTMATASSSAITGSEQSPVKSAKDPSQIGGIKSQDQSMVSPGQYGNMKNPLNSFLIGDSSNYQSSAGGSSVVIRKDGNQKYEKSEMSIDLNEMTMMNQTMMTGSEDHSIQSLLKNPALSSQIQKQKQLGNEHSQSKKPAASEFSIQPMHIGPAQGADVKGNDIEQNEDELFQDLLNDKKSAQNPDSFLSGGQMNLGGQLGVGARDFSFLNQVGATNPDSFFSSIEGEKHAQGLREKYESTDNYNFYKDIVEEEYDFSDGEDDALRVSIKGMADATIKAASEAQVALPEEVQIGVKGIVRESPQYQIDEISEKDEEDDSDKSSSGRGNETTGKQPHLDQNEVGPSPDPKMKIELLNTEEPLRLKPEGSSPAFVFGEVSDAESSGDSVEKAWQLALKGDGSFDGNLAESGEGSDKNDDGRPEFQEPDENELAQLEALKQEEGQNYYEMIRGLVSFNFPSTEPDNQRNLDLAGYYKYMRTQLQLAPGTDYHAKRQLDSGKAGSTKSDLAAHQQELSNVGFHGIQNNEEVLISIVILNNGADIVEAQSKNAGSYRSSFNNIQQYLVPDLSMITLKSALKKILQSVTEDFDGDYYTKNVKDDLLGTHIMKRADFSVLLMLGKQYFHVCKFKQSIYCLSMAQVKCRSRSHKNKEDLAECNMWLALVHMVYLTNRVRIFKRNSEIKNASDGTKLHEYMLMGAKEIFDIYSGLQDTLQEFLGAKDKTTKGVSVVLYIKLKLEIFRQSDLFKKMVQMQVARLEEEQEASLKESSQKWIQDQEQQFQGFGGKQGFRSATRTSAAGMDLGNKGRKGTIKGFLSQGFKGKKKTDEGLTRSTMPVGGGLGESGAQSRKGLGGMFNKGAQQAKSKGQGKNESDLSQSGVAKSDNTKNAQTNAAEQTVRERVLLARNESLRAEDLSMKVESASSRHKLLEDIVKQISQFDTYIGAVAMSEIHFSKIDSKAQKRPNSGSSLGSQPGSPQIEESKYENDYQIESVDFGELQKGIQGLEELIADHPSKILASVKLWQFYRTQGCISSKRQNLNDSRNEELLENYDQAHQIAERLQYNYYQRGSDSITDKTLEQVSVESELIITLLTVKSLYDSENFASCFEILQSGYLGNSKYTGLLYLYGKYVVKSNTTENYKRTQEQKQFLGSGIGALEECLKSCMPEYHSRIYYYIGLAYNKQNSILNMPLKSISYWQQAKTLGFYWPYQGLQKTKIIKKFLDQYSFIQLIINLINESFEASGDCLDEKVPEKQAILAKQYLSVLTSFQEKVDGPSSLILKSNIYAYTLKRPKEAQECFTELSKKYPQVISGYLEHWEYLSKIYKKKRLLAKKNSEKAEALNSKTAKQQAVVEKRESHRLLRELKRITQKALHYSNSCVHVSTSEWVRVRQIAAKTYLLEKKFNKAIHIITDLCYVIPSYMLRIGEDNTGTDNGGIRFCSQILAEDELSDAEMSDDEEGANGQKARQQHEEIIQNDFKDEGEAEEDGSQALFESRRLQTPAEKLLKESREAHDKSKNLKKSQAEQRQVFDYMQGDQGKLAEEDAQYGAPLETEGSNWDMSNFDPLEGQLDTNPNVRTSQGPRGSNASLDSEAAMRKYQQLVNQDKPQRNPKGMQIEIDQGSDQSDNFGHLAEQTPQQIRGRAQKDFQTPKAIGQIGQISGSGKFGKLSSSIAIRTKKKFGVSLASTRSRGSNKRSFNIMTSRGSANKPFQFGERRGSDAVGQSLRIPNSIDRGVSNSMVGSSLKPNTFKMAMEGKFDTNLAQSKMQADHQSVFDAEEYRNVNLMLRDKLPLQENPGDNNDKQTHELEENLIQSNTIFAVNSDVYFLYLIGKMCAQSGHNLFQGLQALNDYYLMTWHHGGANSSEATESKAVTQQKSRNPLNNQSIYSVTSGDRIKECVKALWSMGQIYEKLEQPLLAQKYYLKILEDRERMAKLFGCKKYVLLAEEASGKIFMARASAQMPPNLNQGFMIQSKGSIAEEESYVKKKGGDGMNYKKIIIKQNHF